VKPKRYRLVLLASSHRQHLELHEEYFKNLFDVDEMVVVVSEKTARENIRFGQDLVIVADDGCEKWFPEHRLYKIYWEKDGEQVAAILRGVTKWEKSPRKDRRLL
jgi:hypothetical protein